jgi:hypothetical protein
VARLKKENQYLRMERKIKKNNGFF